MIMRRALPAGIHGAGRQGSDAPPPAGMAVSGAGVFAVPQGMAQVAGEYLAPVTCAAGRGYNAAPMSPEAVAGDLPSRGSRNL